MAMSKDRRREHMHTDLVNSCDLAELAAQQGVQPIADPGQLAGDFWPEQEQIKDFLSALNAWRQETLDNLVVISEA